MQKFLFFLLALLSLGLGAQTSWNPYLMNHERFVHMNQKDKHNLIIRTMEMMVELESKYQHEIKTSGHSSERYEKYVQLLQKLQHFILSEAVASEIKKDEKFAEIATQFTALLETLGSNGCIYGGYVSKVVGKFCAHPSMVTGKHAAAIKTAYHGNSGSCFGPAEISCNPVIFGYQEYSTKTPFCVNAGKEAHNASYACMKLALEEKGDPNTDSRDVRLAAMASAMEAHPAQFNAVHKFIFRTCACGDSTLNTVYLDYMKPHRTCFGMLNTLRVIKNNECANLSDVKKYEFGEKWLDYFGKQEGFDDLDPAYTGDFEKIYGPLMKDNKGLKELCENSTVPVVEVTPDAPVEVATDDEISCSLTLTDDSEKKTITLTLVTSAEAEDIEKIEWGEGMKPIEAEGPQTQATMEWKEGAVSVEATLTLKGQTPIKCPGQRDAPAEENDGENKSYKITAKGAPSDTQVKITAQAFIDDEDVTDKMPDGYHISWTRKGPSLAKTETPEKKKEKKESNDWIQDNEPVTNANTPGKEIAKGKEILEPMLALPYETCASLINNSGEAVATAPCVTIPALKNTSDVTPQQNNVPATHMPKMQPIYLEQRNTSGTAVR